MTPLHQPKSVTPKFLGYWRTARIAPLIGQENTYFGRILRNGDIGRHDPTGVLSFVKEIQAVNVGMPHPYSPMVRAIMRALLSKREASG
jgi:hypothetical protein